MSWNFVKVGVASNVAALKAAINAEHAPQSVKDTLCKGVDEQVRNSTWADRDMSKVAVIVQSYGNLNGDEKIDSYNGEIKLRVECAPLIDTPLEG